MVWPAGRGATLLALGLCALAAAAGVAFATPAHRGSHGPVRTHRRGCAARARARRRGQRHPAGCRTRSSHRRSRPAATAPGSRGTDTTKGVAGSTGSREPSVPGSAAGEPESTKTAPPQAPPSIPHVQVTAVEYSYTLSRTTVPAGKVIFDFVNHGQDEHNLNILPAEGEVVDSFANTPAHVSTEQEVVLKAGTYTLFCSLPEHEKKGMKATLIVE